MYIEKFLQNHTVFTSTELREHLQTVQSLKAQEAIERSIYLLRYHEKNEHILQIRRGLYAVVPKGVTPSEFLADPYLVAAKITDDAILAYNTALQFYGFSHSHHNFRYYLTQDQFVRRFTFQGVTYQPVPHPIHLKNAKKFDIGTTTVNREGVNIRITTIERTFVDALERPVLAGETEELWLSLENIHYLNIEEVIDYTLQLSNRTNIAKVGFFLDEHKKQFHVLDNQLDRLLALRPKGPCYLQRNRTGKQKQIAKWNLIVPESLLNRTWEEPNAYI